MNKTKILIILLFIIGVAALIGAIALLLMNRNKNGGGDIMNTPIPTKPVSADWSTTEKIVWHYMGMAYEPSYTIKKDDAGKWGLYLEEEETFVKELPEDSVTTLIAALETNGVAEWNGFHGSNPDVLDGYMFSLDIYFTDGKRIDAGGTNSFPENFRAVSDAFYEIIG